MGSSSRKKTDTVLTVLAGTFLNMFWGVAGGIVCAGLLIVAEAIGNPILRFVVASPVETFHLVNRLAGSIIPIQSSPSIDPLLQGLICFFPCEHLAERINNKREARYLEEIENR